MRRRRRRRGRSAGEASAPAALDPVACAGRRRRSARSACRARAAPADDVRRHPRSRPPRHASSAPAAARPDDPARARPDARTAALAEPLSQRAAGDHEPAAGRGDRRVPERVRQVRDDARRRAGPPGDDRVEPAASPCSRRRRTRCRRSRRRTDPSSAPAAARRPSREPPRTGRADLRRFACSSPCRPRRGRRCRRDAPPPCRAAPSAADPPRGPGRGREPDVGPRGIGCGQPPSSIARRPTGACAASCTGDASVPVARSSRPTRRGAEGLRADLDTDVVVLPSVRGGAVVRPPPVAQTTITAVARSTATAAARTRRRERRRRRRGGRRTGVSAGVTTSRCLEPAGRQFAELRRAASVIACRCVCQFIGTLTAPGRRR